MKEFSRNLIKNKLNCIYRFYKYSKLNNHSFTIISNNCCGGVIYHDLKQRFLSPTINLYIKPDEFLLFVENLFEALQLQIIEEHDPDFNYPVGVITLSSKKTIHLYFMHYSTFEEAVNKWYERRNRVNKENLFIFMEMGKSTTDERIERFLKLPYKNKLAITNVRCNHKDIKYLKIYDDSYYTGKILANKSGLSAYKRYLDDIDYIKWINGKSED